jgi:uncharacterized membrane protein YcfT
MLKLTMGHFGCVVWYVVSWDLNPTTRHTVWVLVIGGFVHWLQGSAMNQYQMQRYLALPTLRTAKK